jgi:hypothetical protein
LSGGGLDDRSCRKPDESLGTEKTFRDVVRMEYSEPEKDLETPKSTKGEHLVMYVNVGLEEARSMEMISLSSTGKSRVELVGP